jgi:hypothetical protein
MKQLQTGVPGFPDIFICQNKADIELAKQKGLPYLVWKTKDYDRLIKLVLYHLVCKMFPEIDWKKAWGITPRDLAFCNHGNICIADGNDYNSVHEYNINDYLITNDASVNIEQLEALHLLPKFLGDIIDCIRTNITDYTWHDGMNKKTGIWMGNYVPQMELKNLIILDISYSIPVGISSVMLKLIDTIRHKCDADLIVTGLKSYYWSIDEELPTPQEIRDMIPRSNESTMFQDILKKHIAGRHWGHIISFGDGDSPDWTWKYRAYEGTTGPELNEFRTAMQGTEVDMVHHYHTRCPVATGYAELFREFNPKEVYDCSWCSIINNR